MLYSASGPYTTTTPIAFVAYNGIGIICVKYVGSVSLSGTQVLQILCPNGGSYTNTNQMGFAAILYTPTAASRTVLRWNIGFQAAGGTSSMCGTSTQYTQTSEASGVNYQVYINGITGLPANTLDTCIVMEGQTTAVWAV